MEQIKNLIQVNAKAIAAFVVTFVVGLFVKAQFEVPTDIQIAAQGVIVSVIVWFVRNKPQE